jgi:hypothetical protein
MSRATLYKKPTLQFWTSERLNLIEASMSSGGGSSPKIRYIYIVNTPDNNNPLLNLTGHSALLFVLQDGSVELFSFSPYDNKTTPANGAIATTVNQVKSFYEFKQACLANNYEGILISNGYKTWNESFKRAIKLGITEERYIKIYNYASQIKSEPPTYDVLDYNCQIFCNYALYHGGLALQNFLGYPFDSIIPNYVYDQAVGAQNAITFSKSEF